MSSPESPEAMLIDQSLLCDKVAPQNHAKKRVTALLVNANKSNTFPVAFSSSIK